MERGVTARRACRICRVSSAAPYRERAPDKDAPLRERLKGVWRPNMGYRMAHALVRPEFAPLNVKRVHRIWKEERLGRMKRYRKKRTGSSVPLSAEAPSQVWCLDFCHDACLNGTRLKVLAIVDEFSVGSGNQLQVAPRAAGAIGAVRVPDRSFVPSLR